MPRLFSAFFRPPARHAYRLISEPPYRIHCRLTSRYANHPRFSPVRLRLHGWDLAVPDVASFLSAYQAIFVDRIYDFTSDTSEPYIVDCGANIGLSALFFKSRFPRAKILAFEPDPKIAEAFRHNLHRNGFADVELIEKAAWTSEGTLNFFSEGGDAGRLDSGGDKGRISVPTVRLRDYLHGKKIDLLKIDIEGAEVEVVPDCADALDGVRRAFVEHHSFASKPQHLGRMIAAIEERGFRVVVQTPVDFRTPFLGMAVNEVGMDHHLNIFFDRPHKTSGTSGGTAS